MSAGTDASPGTAAPGLEASPRPGTPGALATPGTRVLLIGTARHGGQSDLPDLPSVAPTLAELRRVLVDRCGVAPDHVGEPLLDPAAPAEMGNALVAAADGATDVLLVWYSGHGLIGADDQLYLAAAESVRDSRKVGYTALAYQRLREILAGCRARSVVVVADCCFAGRAGDPVPGLLASLAAPGGTAGGFLLASAAYSEAALAPGHERFTAFGGALIGLLRDGIADGPRLLTLHTVYRALDGALSAQGRPRPQSRSTGSAGDLALAVNPRYQPPKFGDALLPADPGSDAGAPYRGLAAYGEADAEFFFGRDRLVERLRRDLADQLTVPGPLVVLGPSGAGKSSLLRAGLRPSLDQGLPGAGQARSWPKIVFTPGSDPLGSLAGQLGGLLATDPAALRSRLAGPGGLAELAGEVVRRHAGGDDPERQRLVLIADQFEEVFGPEVDAADREAFLAGLAGATAWPGQRSPAVLAVVGLRADFYGRAQSTTFLADALARKRTFDITPMGRDELRDVITGPAAAGGLAVEPELTDRILADLHAEDRLTGRGHDTRLPLLSHALLTTWRYREGTTLTLRGYQAAGGVGGAVAHTASQLWSELADDERDVARRLLLQLVYVGPEGTDVVRRRVPLPELAESLGAGPGRPGGEARAELVGRVLGQLVAARLVTVDRDHAEIVHDALLHTWPQLRDWIDADRVNLAIGRQVAEAAGEWDGLGRHRGDLYDGARLEAAQEWESATRPASGLVADFIHRSRRRARNRRRGIWAGGIAAATALAVIASLLAVSVTDGSNLRARNAELESQQVAEVANTLSATNPGLARSLALSAYHLAPTEEADQALANASVTPAPTELDVGGNALNAAFSRQGMLLAASSTAEHGTVSLWNLSRPGHPVRVGTLPGHRDCALAFLPSAPVLAASCDGVTTLWDLSRPARPVRSTTFGRRLPPGKGTDSVAVSPDGRWLATGATSGLLQLWNISDRPRVSLTGSIPAFDPVAVQSVAFRADSRVLAVGTISRGAFLAPLTGRDPLTRLTALPGAEKTIPAVAFSPRGDLLVTGGATPDFWNAASPSRPKMVSPPTGFSDFDIVQSVAFTPDADTVALGLANGGIQVGTLAPAAIADDSQTYTLPGGTQTESTAVSADGSYVAGAGQDGIVRVWPISYHPSAALVTGAEIHQNVSADGRLEADPVGGSGSGLMQVWDISDPAAPVRDAVLPGSWLAAVFIGHGRLLMTEGPAGIQLWNLARPRSPVAVGRPFTGPDGHNLYADPNPDGTLLAVGDPNTDSIAVWHIEGSAAPTKWVTIPSGQLKGSEYQWAMPAFLNNGVLDIRDDQGNALLRWNVSQHGVARPLKAIGAPNQLQFTSAAACRDEIITAVQGAPVQLWDAANPNRPVMGGQLSPPKDLFGTAVIGGNGNCRLAEATNGGTTGNIQVWDAQNPRSPGWLATIPTTGTVNDIEVSDDGTRVAAVIQPSGSSPNNVLDVWGLEPSGAYTQLAALQVGGAMGYTEFVPHSRLLLFNPPTTNQIVPDILNTDPGANYHAMCTTTQHALTRQDWSRSVPSSIPYEPPC